jgi:cytochrome c
MMNASVVGSILVFLMTVVYSLFQGAQSRKPDENRFNVVTAIDRGALDEPMVFEVLRDGRVYVAERKGALKMYNPVNGLTTVVDSIAVNTKYVNAAGVMREAEDGFVGFTIDPNYDQNNFAYFMYAHPTTAKYVVTRMVLQGTTLRRDTEVTLLEWDAQRETCCHTGGGMTWDPQGNLYITVGNNTGNVIGSQTDQRPGRRHWDDQRGAANTNDFKGKILRIRPNEDGTYAIPEGNLFPPGTPGTLPEIYTMGHRNVWRVSVDSHTGYVYWGEVGPDAEAATEATVEGYDELNQARSPGNFGWPYFIGPNRAYPITDYATGAILPPKDPTLPINDSRHNTGLRDLPPAQPAFVYYPYGISDDFPEVGTGGRSATGGPVYRSSDFPDAARPWPEYYEGKWIVTDLIRQWIMAITMDENGDYVSMERFLPSYVPIEPIDIKFGPDGDLYVLEYGSVWFGRSPDSRLVRIEYNAGNRAPDVRITSTARGGAVPLSLTLSSEGTRDPDGDPLTYHWSVVPTGGGQTETFDTPTATVGFAQPGVYTATLTARDSAGATASESLRIVAGNEPPVVAVSVPGGNGTFFFPDQPLAYAVRVTDREDGTVDPSQVAFSIDYVPETFDVSTLDQADDPVDARTRFAVARSFIAAANCGLCHQIDQPSLGPSFHQVAERYGDQEDAVPTLVASIRGGSTGKWGTGASMPAHPAMTASQASMIAQFVLDSRNTTIGTRPLAGTFDPVVPEGDAGRGRYVLRAVYSDRGAGDLPVQTSEHSLVLRSPILAAGTADEIVGANTAYARQSGIMSVIPMHGGWVAFRNLDLTGVRALELTTRAVAREGHFGGTIEVRLGSPTGRLLGQVEVAPSQAGPTATQIQQAGGQGQAAAQQQGPGRIELPAGVSGVGDLYFVFHNPTVREIDPLLNLSIIRFVP